MPLDEKYAREDALLGHMPRFPRARRESERDETDMIADAIYKAAILILLALILWRVW